MATAKIGLIGLVLAGGILTFTLWRSSDQPEDCALAFTSSLNIEGSGHIAIALARTPEEQRQGLAGCRSLPPRTGLLFPLSPPRQAVFWMHGMLMPIDIVWLREGHVIGVTANIAPPLDPAATDLPRYSAPEPADAVLELAAGEAARLGIDESAWISY